MTPTIRAKTKFDSYAAMDDGELPAGLVDMSQLQVRLVRWQRRNFDGSSAEQIFKGVVEELGELAHAMLKHEQGIRGFNDRDKFLEAAGDAIADMMVYMTQLATKLRLDVGVLYAETAEEVMKRDWKSNPVDAAEKV